MPHLPRPTFSRLDHDVETLFDLAHPELVRASTAHERARVLRRYLMEAFSAGIEAQRELAIIVIEHSKLK